MGLGRVKGVMNGGGFLQLKQKAIGIGIGIGMGLETNGSISSNNAFPVCNQTESVTIMTAISHFIIIYH